MSSGTRAISKWKIFAAIVTVIFGIGGTVFGVVVSAGITQTLHNTNQNTEDIKRVDNRVDSLAVKQAADFRDMAMRQDTFMIRMTEEQKYSREKLDDIGQTLREIKRDLRKP